MTETGTLSIMVSGFDPLVKGNALQQQFDPMKTATFLAQEQILKAPYNSGYPDFSTCTVKD